MCRVLKKANIKMGIASEHEVLPFNLYSLAIAKQVT